MNSHDLLKHLDRDGAQLELSLRGSNLTPEHKAFIRENRDALLEHLARTRYPAGSGLHFYGDLLNSLMAWVVRYYELRLEHPGGTKLDAKPDHVTGALTRYPWGVLYTAERYVLLTWGDVPTSALLEKRDLLTDEPLVPETRAA